MSPARRDLIVAVLLSSATAAVIDSRPPTLEATTDFIAVAVQRHHVRMPSRGDHERAWNVQAEPSGCVIEKRTSLEMRVLGTWEPRILVARWRLMDMDPEAVRVATETGTGRTIFVVTLPCDDDRACVEGGSLRQDRVSFEFTSALIAQRVAAAFRHAASLCDVVH
jgi:hypothetical protein